MLLEDRVAVISGAATAKGIGLATAQLFAEQGATVAVLDLERQAPVQVAASIGKRHRGYVCDVTKKDQCEGVARQIIEDFGGVDILINNAGITQPIRIMGIEPHHYDAVLDVNLRGMLYLSQAFIPHFLSRGKGSIASTSSVSALTGGGFFGGPHYSAAKAGMLGLTKDMARELGPKGIRVNAVAPGMVDTDIRGDLMSQEIFDKIVSTIPMGRIASPREIASAFLEAFIWTFWCTPVTGRKRARRYPEAPGATRRAAKGETKRLPPHSSALEHRWSAGWATTISANAS
jgi:NAD(P)-dependent dehydrogenase (short-subunit alcohol dehydrogenase family)